MSNGSKSERKSVSPKTLGALWQALSHLALHGGSPKPVKHRHGRAMGAGHLNDEGALDLIWGLAPSMNAKLAFTAISEIPLFGSQSCRRFL